MKTSTKCIKTIKEVRYLYGMTIMTRMLMNHLQDKKTNKTSSRREDKEQKIESAFEELSSKHGDKYTKSQYRLWSRMIVNDIHESYDSPP